MKNFNNELLRDVLYNHDNISEYRIIITIDDICVIIKNTEENINENSGYFEGIVITNLNLYI